MDDLAKPNVKFALEKPFWGFQNVWWSDGGVQALVDILIFKMLKWFALL